MSDGTRLAIKNLNWLLLEKAVALPISLIVNILVARYLGVGKFGEYQYLLSLVALFAPIGVLGLSGIVTKELVSETQSAATVLGTSIVGRLIGTITALLGLMAIAFFALSEHAELLVFLALMQVLSSLQIFSFWFQAQHLNQYDVVVRLSVLVLASTAKLVAIKFDGGIEALIYIAGMEYLAHGVLLLLFFRFQGGESKLVVNTFYMRELLKKSSYLVLSGVAASVYLKIDQIMLANMVGDEAVGLYAVASRISEIWYFIPAAIATAFFPNLLKLKSAEPDAYNRKLQQLSDLLLWLAVVIAVIVNLLASWAIPLLYGEAFFGAVPILCIHIFAGLFIFVRALLSKWLLVEGLLRFSLVTQVTGAVTNVLLNWWLIPEFGAIGAAWATLLSYASASYLALYFSRTTRVMAWVMTRSVFAPARLVSEFRTYGRR